MHIHWTYLKYSFVRFSNIEDFIGLANNRERKIEVPFHIKCDIVGSRGVLKTPCGSPAPSIRAYATRPYIKKREPFRIPFPYDEEFDYSSFKVKRLNAVAVKFFETDAMY